MVSSSPIVIRNPNSGDGRRSQQARDIALERGYEILDSKSGAHATELATEAAERTETVVACGGDGTLNRTVQGVLAADCLNDISFGVVPAGTGNDFADNIGIHGIRHAFDVLETGEERRLDLGMANGSPFLNSCVAGLTAESSSQTPSSLKRRLGVLAYVLTTLSIARNFEGLTLRVSVGPDGDVWSGDALMLLIGNGRQFPGERMRQANMEDGLLNVVIIQDAPAFEYLSRGVADRLLRRKASHLTRTKASQLHVTHKDGPLLFSLDGEIVAGNELMAESRPQAMQFFVGPRYDPTPSERRSS